MNRDNRTGSHLFFIEFIIVLFFFLIVSTVCLRLFARAHGITQQADALSHAQAASASVAAVVEDLLADPGKKSADGDLLSAENLLQTAAEYLPGASLSTLPDDPSNREGLVIFYDRDFQTCAADDARYLLTAALDPADSLNGQNSLNGQDSLGEQGSLNRQNSLNGQDSLGESAGQGEPVGQNEQSNSTGQGKAVETLFISVTDYDHTPVYELSVALYRPMTRKEALQ